MLVQIPSAHAAQGHESTPSHPRGGGPTGVTEPPGTRKGKAPKKALAMTAPLPKYKEFDPLGGIGGGSKTLDSLGRGAKAAFTVSGRLPILSPTDKQGATTALQWMLGDGMPAERFFAEHWEQRPLVVQRGNPCFYDTLAFSKAEFLSLVDAGRIRHGKNVHWSRYCKGKRQNRKMVGRASVPVATRLFTQGFTAQVPCPILEIRTSQNASYTSVCGHACLYYLTQYCLSPLLTHIPA